MALQTGDVIDGKYRIVRVIGEGGMGAVYEAEHGRIHRRVAIKVLLPLVAGDLTVVQRFEREAQAAGRIGNDHILEVFDLGHLPDGSRYIVMEFLEGEPLSERIRRFRRLPPDALVPLARQILVGLDAAHAAGIVHRDLKPDNVFVLHNKVGHKDFVKLIDFGISKFQAFSGDHLGMTKTGAVIGTPYYMSPEQAAGTTVLDKRTDLYAVGVILYEAVTGIVPFQADSFNQLIIKIALTDPPPATRLVSDLDPAFASIISKAMMRDPALRFQSAGEFIQALDGWLVSGRGVSVPPSVADPNATSEDLTTVAAAATMVAPIQVVAPRPAAVSQPPQHSPDPGRVSAEAGGNWAASPGGSWAASQHGSWAASRVEPPAAQTKSGKGGVFIAGALVGATLLAALGIGLVVYKKRATAAAEPVATSGVEAAAAPASPPSAVIAPEIEPTPTAIVPNPAPSDSAATAKLAPTTANAPPAKHDDKAKPSTSVAAGAPPPAAPPPAAPPPAAPPTPVEAPPPAPPPPPKPPSDFGYR